MMNQNLPKINLEKKMDYRNVQNITYYFRNKSNFLFIICGIICLLNACNPSGEFNHPTDEVFQATGIPEGKLLVKYMDDEQDVYTLFWDEDLFCFKVYEFEKYTVTLDGKAVINNITYGDIEVLLNDSVLYNLQLEVRCNGKIVKGGKANRIKNYLIAMMLEYSPIIPKFQSFCEGHETRSFGYNRIYKYDETSEWHSVEITLGTATGNYGFFSEQSIKVFKDSLIFNYFDARKVYPIDVQETDSISMLLRQINVNGAIYKDWLASGLYGNQIYVDNRLIYQSFPMGMGEIISSVPYDALYQYIESLCPEKFIYNPVFFDSQRMH